MNKIYTLALFLAGFAGISRAQLNCGDTYTDTGGPTGTYSSDENDTVTACPTTPGQVVVATFTSFDTEEGYDSLTIYNGNSAMDMMIGSYTGSVSPGTVFSTNPNGCLTFVWASDISVTYDGWEATISCVDPITCFAPTALMSGTTTETTAEIGWTASGSETSWMVEYGPAGFAAGTGTEVVATTNPFTLTGLMGSTNYDYYVSAICSSTDTSFTAGPSSFMTAIAPFICGNLFVDNGGPGDYGVNTADTVTICPTNPGDIVLLDFSSFSVEEGYDSLMIYNGNSIADQLIATYTGTLDPFTVYSTNPNGCLTAMFWSDEIIADAGWEATINCIAPITCFEPTNLMADTTTTTTATLSWTAGGAETQWVVEYGAVGFTEGTGTMVLATTNPFTLTGLMGSMAYDFYVRSYCGGTDTSFSAGPQMFGTQIAPFDCGNLFVDNGGAFPYNADSGDTTTICPNGDFDIVEVVFSAFDTEEGYDSLMIYNGNSTMGAFMGTYQGLDNPGTVTSTSPDGCLTFVFLSDGSVQHDGWSAMINCQFNAGINENAEEMVTVYPNPSNGKFTIENLAGTNLSYSVNDMQGRSLNMNVNSGAAQSTIDLSNYENGVYFLVVSNGTSTKTYSLVKN
ncbi:MAG: CUB domain-containing protein [Bacteroidota bacterium]